MTLRLILPRTETPEKLARQDWLDATVEWADHGLDCSACNLVYGRPGCDEGAEKAETASRAYAAWKATREQTA